MGLLRRSSSRRRQKDQQGTTVRVGTETWKAQRQNHFRIIDEAVDEHRKSMKERPSTSCGVERGKHGASNKRTAPAEAKELQPTCLDDLRKAGNVVEYKDGPDTFRFPTPSPRTPSMPRSATTATCQHSPSRLQSSSSVSPAIGIANGSPAHPPPTWDRSVTADHISPRMPQKLPPRRAPPSPPAARVLVENNDLDVPMKKSGWKTFKAAFRRRPAGQAPKLAETSKPYSELAPFTEPRITTLAPSEASSLDLPRPVSSKQRHRRMHSGSSIGKNLPRSHPRFENHSPATRSSVMPTLKGKLRALNTRGSTMPSPSPADDLISADVIDPPDARHDSPMSQNKVHFIPSPNSSTPRLDLQFERPEFERYSVMFQQLLSNDSRPSLLERRQSRLSRRKTGKRVNDIKINDKLEAVTQIPGTPKRALTSPHLTRRLSIQVDGANNQNENSDAPSTTARRPQLMQRANTLPVNNPLPTRANFPQQRKATLESSPDSPHSALFSETSLPPTPTTVTSCTDTDSVHRLQQGHSQHPSDWTTATTSSDTVKASFPAAEPYARVKSPEDLEHRLVRVSVARQASVTRARTRVQRAVSNSNFKQPQRPHVVELGLNRKSSAGVLDMAEGVSLSTSRVNLASASAAAAEVEESTGESVGAGSPTRSRDWKERGVVVDSSGKRRMVRPPTLGPFPPDPLKLNPPTPRVATFAEGAGRR